MDSGNQRKVDQKGVPFDGDYCSPSRGCYTAGERQGQWLCIAWVGCHEYDAWYAHAQVQVARAEWWRTLAVFNMPGKARDKNDIPFHPVLCNGSCQLYQAGPREGQWKKGGSVSGAKYDQWYEQALTFKRANAGHIRDDMVHVKLDFTLPGGSGKPVSMDKHGVEFDPHYCSAVRGKYIFGKWKGQWRKRARITAREYDQWYEVELRALIRSMTGRTSH